MKPGLPEANAHQLHESERKFRLLFEHSGDAILLLDTTVFRFTDCNEAAVAMLGYDREELLGKHPWDLSPEFQPDGMRSVDKANGMLSVIVEKKTHRFEWMHIRKGGELFPAEVLLTSLQIGDRPLLAAVLRDITERKKADREIQELNATLERRVTERTAELSNANARLQEEIAERHKAQTALHESEAKFRLLFEKNADAILLFDALTSSFVDCNDAAVEMMRAGSKHELLAMNPAALSPEFQPDGLRSEDKIRANMPETIRKGSDRFEWVHRRMDGEEFPVEVVLTNVQIGERPLFVTVWRDITDRKRAEQELHRTLAKEKELSELKSSFVSMVSHEFRTPLAVILSSVELLKNHFEKLPSEIRTQQLETIHQSTLHMSKLIDEVLLLGKVEAGKLQFTPAPIDLPNLCRILIDELLSATQRKCPIEFCAKDISEAALTDEALLRHILLNLVSNAVKYSPAGRPVRLEVCREERKAVFKISDSGIGIPDLDRRKLFQAFHRGRNVGQAPGNGLGLVIVKRCVDLHEGQIDIQSTVNVGTTVTVQLPVFPGAPKPKPLRRTRAAGNRASQSTAKPKS